MSLLELIDEKIHTAKEYAKFCEDSAPKLETLPTPNQLLSLLRIAVKELQYANTYLLDIYQVKKENFTKEMSGEDMFDFCREVAGNGFSDSTKTLTQIKSIIEGEI